MSAEIWLVIHEDLRSSPAVRVVMDFLLDCFEAFVYNIDAANFSSIFISIYVKATSIPLFKSVYLL